MNGTHPRGLSGSSGDPTPPSQERDAVPSIQDKLRRRLAIRQHGHTLWGSMIIAIAKAFIADKRDTTIDIGGKVIQRDRTIVLKIADPHISQQLFFVRQELLDHINHELAKRGEEEIERVKIV